jgi:flagellar hook assembly protein FlgD
MAITGAQQREFVRQGDLGVQYATPGMGAEEFDMPAKVDYQKEEVKIESADAPDALQKLFTDPEKMLQLWLVGETKQNPFAQEQKDPMESFGKFIQAMLMQTQTGALKKLEETMVRNNKYAASNLIGEFVEIETDKMQISQARRITENFTVPEEADAFAVEIKNTDGAVVYQTLVQNPGAGINQFEWNGKNNDDQEVPFGDYSISISLLKKQDNPDGPPTLAVLEYARTLDGVEIHDKVETLSMIDREVQFSYEIPENIPGVTHASVWITNSKGHAVHKGEIDIKEGEKGVYSWNCLDTLGNRVPEDAYTVSFNFKDSQRKLIHTEAKPIVRVAGKVQGVEINDKGEPNLVTSRIKAPLSTVKRIVNEQGL